MSRLLELYPAIDRLVIWFRHNPTPLRGVKPEMFPASWRARYEAILAREPAMRFNQDAAPMFAISRVTAAFARALSELGRAGVELGCGTWHPDHLPAAHAFFDPGVKFYWLDWRTEFDQPKVQALVRSIPAARPMVPVVWAHHDDRTYIGRPYQPYPRFADLINGAGTGFGIIHWTMRPLDLYFKSLSEQTWKGTVNRPLRDTLRGMALRSFGPQGEETGTAYLERWMEEGPMFGRETTDRFIDVPLTGAAETASRCRERLKLLEQPGGEALAYFREYEKFTALFFETHAAYERACARRESGDASAARLEILGADPGAVIEQYVRAASQGKITRGEQAIVVSLNLRWLPYFVSLRQALGIEPARYRFTPTQHEPLAQNPGRNTFWIDESGALWKALGEKETGAPVTAAGLRLDKPLTLDLAASMGDAFVPGRCSVKVLATAGVQAAAPLSSSGKFSVTLTPPPGGGTVRALELQLDPATP